MQLLYKKHRKTLAHYLPLAVMLMLPIAVLGPLYARGYILHYDMVFSPHVHLNLDMIREGIGLYQSLPLAVLLKLANFVIPMDIVQKLILSAIIFLSAYTMYRIVPVKSLYARLLAGVIYALNPFVYDRLMAGHWGFLLAYSLTPLVLWAFYKLYSQPRRRHLAYAVLLWSLAVLASSHHTVILGLLFVCLGLFFVRSKRSFLYALATIASVLLLNLWWIIPAYSIDGSRVNFSLEHFYAFATRGDLAHGLWFNMLALQGFWHDGWQSIKDFFGYWPLLVMVWLLPVLVGLGGISRYIQNHRKLLLGLLLASLLSLIFAAGPNPAVWQLNTWLYEHIPALSGLREPQKLLSLLALTYAVLAALGMDLLIKYKKKLAAGLGIVAVMATILMARPMLWGTNGQLETTRYPASWHQFYAHLQNDGQSSKAIVLPWELYVEDSFVDGLVAQPAKAFYGERVLQSQRMRLPEIEDREPRHYDKIRRAAQDRDYSALKAAASEVKADYVMITDTQRGDKYAWLMGQPDAKVLINDRDLLVIVLTK